MNPQTALDYTRELYHEIALESKCSYQLNLDSRKSCQKGNSSSVILPIQLDTQTRTSIISSLLGSIPLIKDVYFFLNPKAMYDHETVGYVHIYSDRKLVFVSFHGTDSIETTVSDLETQWTRLRGVLVDSHWGFTVLAQRAHPKILEILKNNIIKNTLPNYDIIYTGHSLGGAVAAVAGTEMAKEKSINLDMSQVKIVTFASPMVFKPPNLAMESVLTTRDFLSILPENYIRFEDPMDVVPKLPGPLLGYKHLGLSAPTYSLGSAPPFASSKEILFDQLNDTLALQKSHWTSDKEWLHSILPSHWSLEYHNLDNYIANLNNNLLLRDKWSAATTSKNSCDPHDVALSLILEKKMIGIITCSSSDATISCSNGGGTWNIIQKYEPESWEPMFSHLQKTPCILSLSKSDTISKISTSQHNQSSVIIMFIIILFRLINSR